MKRVGKTDDGILIAMTEKELTPLANLAQIIEGNRPSDIRYGEYPYFEEMDISKTLEVIHQAARAGYFMKLLKEELDKINECLEVEEGKVGYTNNF